MAASLTLYDNFNAVCGQKVRFALEEKQLAYERVEMNLRKGETLTSDYLKLNPAGVVPTLVHDGYPVIESTVICEYIDEVFPQPSLTPADPHDRARMRLWTKFVDEVLHPACGSLTWAIAIRPDVLKLDADAREAHLQKIPDPKRRERQRTALRDGLGSATFLEALQTHRALVGKMEDALRERSWFAGEDLSLADIGVLPYIVRLDMLRFSKLWRRADSTGVVDRWLDALRQRPAFSVCFERDYPLDYVQKVATRGEAARDELGL